MLIGQAFFSDDQRRAPVFVPDCTGEPVAGTRGAIADDFVVSMNCVPAKTGWISRLIRENHSAEEWD